MNEAISVPDDLRRAIDAYFQYKREHNGLFPDNDTRERFHEDIFTAARKIGVHTVIAPGHIWLECNDTVYSFSTVQPQGYLDVDMTKRIRGIQ